MKRKYLYELLGGALLIVVSTILRVSLPGLEHVTGMMASVGVGLGFVALIQHYRFGEEEVEDDERTRRICLRSQSYSWVLTFFTLLALGLANLLLDLSAEVIVLALLFVMSLSMLFSLLYLERKPGNV